MVSPFTATFADFIVNFTDILSITLILLYFPLFAAVVFPLSLSLPDQLSTQSSNQFTEFTTFNSPFLQYPSIRHSISYPLNSLFTQ